MSKILILLLALGLLTACEKRYSTNQQPKKASKVTLTGMTPEKVVKTKYNSLRVVCGMNSTPTWSPVSVTLARAEWNILQEFSEARAIQFSASLSENNRVQVIVHLDRLSIVPTLTVRDDSGSEYLMKNTPAVHARVEWQETTGTRLQKGLSARMTLIEGIPAPLLNLTTTTGESDQADQVHQLRIQCEIIAGLKPEYQDEFFKKN